MISNMEKITVFAIAYLFVVIVPSLAQVSWSVNNTVEFRNGDTMELICAVTGSCCSTSRLWNGGPSFSVLMNAGAPSDAAKYAEVVHSNSFSLLIYNMDKSDFLYDYRCSNGFDVSSRGLLSPPGNARYVPATSEIKILSSSAGDSLNFKVNVTTVFPAPSCTAKFGSADLTSSMTVTTIDDSPFKFAEISMTNVAYTCPGSLNVSCSVGSYSFDVLFFDPCKENDEGGLSHGEKAAIAVPTVTVCGGAVAGGIIYLVYVINLGVIIVLVKKGQDKTFGDSSLTSGVQWTKDGKKLKSNCVVGNRCKVVKASDDDEGVYVCTLGKYTMKYRLIVLDEIVYIKEGLHKELGEGNITDAVWKKNNKVVKSPPGLRTKFYISNSSVKDDGLYVCILKSDKKQFKYYVVVVGTEDTVYVYEGFKTEFGKTIPDEDTTKNAKWTQNSKQVGSDHSEHTKFSIDSANLKLEGLYVCSFGDKHMHQLKYHIIVVDTNEIISVNKGDELRFGKALPMKHVPSNTKWTHQGASYESDNIKGTEIEIKMASKEDGGLYVLTFGSNNMQCRYNVIVSDLESNYANKKEFSESKIANDSADSNNEIAKIKKLKKKRNKDENEKNKESFVVTETVDETQHRSQNDKKLPPIENSQNDKKLPPVETPTYLGSSNLDQKPFGAPLPTILSTITQDNTDKST